MAHLSIQLPGSPQHETFDEKGKRKTYVQYLESQLENHHDKPWKAVSRLAVANPAITILLIPQAHSGLLHLLRQKRLLHWVYY